MQRRVFDGVWPSNGGMGCRLVGSSSFRLVLKREEYGGRPRESSFETASRWRTMIEMLGGTHYSTFCHCLQPMDKFEPAPHHRRLRLMQKPNVSLPKADPRPTPIGHQQLEREFTQMLLDQGRICPSN